MHTSDQVSHYKTLGVIKFYNEVYEFVSRYLIFVFAGTLSVIAVLIIWIWEPATVTKIDISKNTNSSFVQETGLIYPVNYFAGKSIEFEGKNKIFGLGGPIWSTQKLGQPILWNSIDNIVQYKGVILPRQISRSAWVSNFTQPRYSLDAIKILLEGMGTSQVDLSAIQSSIKEITKPTPEENIIDMFGIGCSNRMLFTIKFCDLKMVDALQQWNHYDLSGAGDQLTQIHDYIFNVSTNIANQQLFCTTMLQQYRYSGSAVIAEISKGCSDEITTEIDYISRMIAINQEVSTNQFTNKVYDDDSINNYKLMSWYQYLMTKIQGGEYLDQQDDETLTTYGSYITKLVNSETITQPYGDIISVFHQQYLVPWLEERESYASQDQKEITKQLIQITNLIIQGDSTQNIIPVTQGSRIQSVEFLISQGIYDEPNTYTGNNTAVTINTTPTQVDSKPSVESTNTSGATNSGDKAGATNESDIISQSQNISISELVSQVLGTQPTKLTKKGTMLIISYNYQGEGWFATVELANRGNTTLYYESPDSGATKITHKQVTFEKDNKNILESIMIEYLSTKLK